MGYNLPSRGHRTSPAARPTAPSSSSDPRTVRRGRRLSSEEASAGFQLAAVVAEYAEILRDSYWAREGSLADVRAETGRLLRLISSDVDVEEFAALVSQAQRLEERVSNR